MFAAGLWKAWDGGNVSTLALLDLSVAFDTISCDIPGGRRPCNNDSASPIPVGVGRRERSSPRPSAFQLPQGLTCSRVLFHVYMKALHMVWHRVEFHQ